MSVARAAELKPLHRLKVPVTKRALVIGGGVAGMHTALALAKQGIAVDVIEREAGLGGSLHNVRFLTDLTNFKDLSTLQWLDAQDYLQDLIEQVNAEPLITIHLQTEQVETEGYKGNLTSTLRNANGDFTIKHGATIVAVGAQEYRGPEYGYGSDPRIITQQEFEAQLAGENGREVQNVAMIQCVGPAEQYCSRTCCTIALKNALKLKQLNPVARITVLYRDIRTYGFKERLYTEARRNGVIFIQYDADRKPQVEQSPDGSLTVRVWEPMLGREMTLRPDRLILSMPMVPAAGVEQLANRLKVGVDLDGWLMEAHVKLRPVDFSTEGFYMAGAAHYPKLLDETIAQAQAAASRAATILTQDTLEVGGIVAQVSTDQCVGCLTCVRTCPFGVPKIKYDLMGVGEIAGAAYIEPAQCQGCGTCVAACPAKAIDLMHYTDAQVLPKIDALLTPQCMLKEPA